MVAAATIGAAVIGAAASESSSRRASKDARRAEQTEIQWAQEQYDDWQAVYGPIQDNLSEYYQNVTPDYIEAQGLENYQKEYDRAMTRVNETLAQRGISNSGLAAEVQKDMALDMAENRARIRAEAPMQAAREQARFLQIGLGQNPSGDMQQILSNRAADARGRANLAQQQSGQATQAAVTTIFDVMSNGTNNTTTAANNAAPVVDAVPVGG